MTCRRLRVFHQPHARLEIAEFSPPTANVTIPLGDILPLLIEAMQTQRLWVNDFLDEEITLSRDLYEVLQAYEHYCMESET